MNGVAVLVSLLLSAMGLTILIVWPETGPGAWVRERGLRPLLPERVQKLPDCYICLGFWAGLACSPVWWLLSGFWWTWTACLMTPAAFWLVLREPRVDAAEPDDV